MKIGPMTYKPATNWLTVILLAAFVLGFGIVADSHVQHHASPELAGETGSNPSTPQAILRLN